jgi:hypothetical protein
MAGRLKDRLRENIDRIIERQGGMHEGRMRPFTRPGEQR